MKVIFLDIDGVLNSKRFNRSRKKRGKVKRSRNPTNYERDLEMAQWMLDPVPIGLLNNIIRQTDAKVVISSVWKATCYWSVLQEALKSKGFQYEIYDRTPTFREKWSVRGNEIQAWLDEHKPEGYLIIDDDSDMLYSQKDHLLLIENNVGLTKKDAKEAIMRIRITERDLGFPGIRKRERSRRIRNFLYGLKSWFLRSIPVAIIMALLLGWSFLLMALLDMI